MSDERPELNNESEEGYSLESILAEYKAQAFIDGEKRLYGKDLAKKTAAILGGKPELYEEQGDAPGADDREEDSPFVSGPEPEDDDLPWAEEPEEKESEPESAEETTEDEKPRRKGFFSLFARKAPQEEPADEEWPEPEQEDEEEEPEPEPEEAPKKRRKRVLSRTKDNSPRRKAEKDAEAEAEEFYPPEPEPPELSVAEASRVYGVPVNSLFLRGICAAIISFFMCYSALAYTFGFPFPEALRNVKLLSLVLLALEVITVCLGMDIFIYGIKDLRHKSFGVETLVVLSCVFSIVDSIVVSVVGDNGLGLPFSAVSAVSMTFAIWGVRTQCMGLRCSLSMAAISSEPYTLMAETEKIENGIVLNKTHYPLDGFVRRTERPDICETVYELAAPVLFVAAVALAIISSALNKTATDFIHTVSAMLAVTASFSALLIFAYPFYKVSKKLMRSGATIAGWSGARDIAAAVGVVIRDEDIFPTGTLTLNGIRIFPGNSMQKVVSYTASVIITSGCGLTEIFADLLKNQDGDKLHCADFSFYEAGGMGAVINGEKVYVGSYAFMNLMGIRLPQELSVKTAVFSAIGGELAGVFAVNYTPANSVQGALLSLLSTRVIPLFAVRDFNISPAMISQKFKISMEKAQFLTIGERYALSETESEKPGDSPLAALCREGLAPLADTVRGARHVVFSARLSAVISILCSVVGMLLAFFLVWKGAFGSLSCANMLVYMLLWTVPVFLIGNLAGKY